MGKVKKIGILASAALLVWAYFMPALGDENSWSTGGPDGATVMTIAVHTADSLRIYIGTVHSGIFRTTNGGAEWSRIEDDTLHTCIRVIKFHPRGPDTMYATTMEGMFKSTDAGEAWSRLPFPYPTNEHRTFEIHPDDPSMLFTDGMFKPYKSTDGGETWYGLDNGLGTIVNVEEIKVDPINTNVVYFTGGSDFKSTNYGEYWSEEIRPDSINTGTNGWSLAIDPVNSQIIYLGRYDGNSIGTCLYKSTNGGSNWTDITPPGLVGALVTDVLVSPLDHNMVFITSLEDGIFRSADGGENWEEMHEGLVVRDAASMVADPRTGNLYLGQIYDGIHRSTNNGDSWEKISYNVTGALCTDIAANWRHPDSLYTATKAGLFISTDGAESWERIMLDIPYHQFFCHQVEVDPYDPSYVYLPLYGYDFDQGTYYGTFYRSADGGSTWESFTEGLPSNSAYSSIAVADYYDSGHRRLFMGTTAGLYFSDDLAESWFLCQEGLPSNVAFAAIDASPANPEIVFVGDHYSNNVYKSADGGQTWVELDMPRGERINQTVCDPVDQDIVYVIIGPHSGIFKSTDGGQTWDNIDNNLPREGYFSVSGIAINPLNHDNIFIYSYRRGLYESHDGGQYWEEFFHESLRKGSGATTLVDPVDTSRVFISLYGNSVWWIKRTGTGIADDRDILPVAFSSSCYPNPFNPSATIEYSLPEEASVTVEIYDLLGRRVETLANENQRAGRHRVVWDAKDRASGLYFYRINADESFQMGKMILLK